MPLWTMDDMSSLSPAEIYSSCAVGMTEHFRMERCLDIVLEVLRQDLDFYDFYFGYLYETMLSAITYMGV